MPVPKRKTSKARRDSRSANKGIKPKAFAICKNCEHPNAPHQVCTSCGFYKGVKVLQTKMDRKVKRGESSQAKQKAQKSSANTQE